MICCHFEEFIPIGLGVWRNPNWLGTLYPTNTKPKDMLKTYATVFNAVEGNSTFHAVPSSRRLLAWAEQTPKTFTFFFKFPRSITHFKKLQGTDDEITYFIELLTLIRAKVGTLMIQLPPSFSPSMSDRLIRLVKFLPKTFNYAIEFRHPGFFVDPNLKIYKLIKDGIFSLVILDNRLKPTILAKNERKNFTPIDPGQNPIVRYVDTDENFDLERITTWGHHLQYWQQEGRRPAFFSHTQTDTKAPEIAQTLHNSLYPNHLMHLGTSGQLPLF